MNPNNNFEDLHRLKHSDIVDYFSFYDLNFNLLEVKNITINNYGQIGDITVTTPQGTETLDNTQYTYTRESVYVLGVGYLIPGDIVKLHLLDRCYYEVKYGWHTNVSNQVIHSWYLVPVDYDKITKEVAYRTDSNILTLYKKHLETIEVVEFRRNRASFYDRGEPNG